jgi:hypothetical protein
MRTIRMSAFALLALTAGLVSSVAISYAQEPAILGAAELEKVVPNNFYFEGQLGPTQMRNAAAVRFGDKQHLVAALVDTSGYASNIRSKYEGFIISDTRFFLRRIASGGGMGSAASVEMPAGAYGFGFTEDLKMNIFDVGGKKLQTVNAAKDDKLQSPRPLLITKNGNELRLYRGRTYVVIAAK